MATSFIPYSQEVIGDIKELSSFTLGNLGETNKLYDVYDDEWSFMQAAYDGAKALVAFGVMLRHERESTINYNRRIDEAYGFSYSRSIIDLFNHYLSKEPVKRDLGVITDDKLWIEFQKDCNLDRDSFDDFLLLASKWASISGHCGILVDKPNVKLSTRQEEIDNAMYPYTALYSPLAILDWKYERDKYNRPKLVYLKLKDDDDLYRMWFPDRWEIWKEVEEKGEKVAEKVDYGTHHLGEIPFVWLYNGKTSKKGLGYSDISDIARIDASIIRNLSQGEEIINYAAFPMLIKPKREHGTIQDDEVGVTAVLEFDPENPQAKPDWLEAKVLEPIDALFNMVIERKVKEIYRSANIGGMAATEIQDRPKSGVALKTEFQLLNSKLVSKGKALEKAEKEIIRLWLKWQKKEELYDQISIERSSSYDVLDLAQDLENILTSMTVVRSDTFRKKIQKKATRLMLPNEADSELAIIDGEIDSYSEPIGDYVPPRKGEIPGETNKTIPLREEEDA